MKSFSSNLASALKNLNMTQRELSRRTRLTQAAICQYVAGEREPQLGVFLKICKAMDTRPDVLLGFHDNAKKENMILKEKIKAVKKVLN